MRWEPDSRRSSEAQRGPGGPWWMANCSSGLKGHVEELGRCLTMIETVGNHAQRKGLDARKRLRAILAVAHDSAQRRHLSEPAAVVLSLGFDSECHGGNVAPSLVSNKWFTRPASPGFELERVQYEPGGLRPPPARGGEAVNISFSESTGSRPSGGGGIPQLSSVGQIGTRRLRVLAIGKSRLRSRPRSGAPVRYRGRSRWSHVRCVSRRLVGRFTGVSFDTDDIERAYRRLFALGVPFQGPPEKQDWGGSLAHFRDPDGNLLTLVGS